MSEHDNDAGSNDSVIDPAALGTGAAPVEPAPAKRGRGRPKGSGKRAAGTGGGGTASGTGKKEKAALDLSSLTGALVGLHYMLAVKTGHEELMLEESEAKNMMKAAQNVARHYSVETTQKTLDIIALFVCVGGVYGPRAVAIAAKKKGGSVSPPTADVIDFPFPPPNVGEADWHGGPAE